MRSFLTHAEKAGKIEAELLVARRGVFGDQEALHLLSLGFGQTGQGTQRPVERRIRAGFRAPRGMVFMGSGSSAVNVVRLPKIHWPEGARRAGWIKDEDRVYTRLPGDRLHESGARRKGGRLRERVIVEFDNGRSPGYPAADTDRARANRARVFARCVRGRAALCLRVERYALRRQLRRIACRDGRNRAQRLPFGQPTRRSWVLRVHFVSLS